MSREQIGTVRVTRDRVYPLDPRAPEHLARTEVIVKPGEYPVYRDGISHYWRMTGVIDHQICRMGDGAIGIHDFDVHSDDDVVFYSERYGPDEWAKLLEFFTLQPDPRLVFSITRPGPGWSAGVLTIRELRDRLTLLGSRDWDLSTSRLGLEEALEEAEGARS